MYQSIIIGLGPAGLTAGVYAARQNLDVLVIGKEFGGQVSWTSEVENYMGFQYISGPELISRFKEHVKQYPVERKREEVESITGNNGSFTVKCKNGEEYSAQTLIVAAGKSPRRLEVPGEKKFTGRGVSYCSVCDAPLFSGKKVAVVGSEGPALEAAHDLVQIAEHVYVVSAGEWSAGDNLINKVKDAGNLTKLAGWNVTGIEGKDLVRGITLQSVHDPEQQKQLDVDGVFIEIGTIPNSGLVKGLLDLNENGEIKVDCSCRTSVPGIFAAGDITDIPEKQIIVAAGEGAKAALSAYKYLLEQDTRAPAITENAGHLSRPEETLVH